MTEKRIGELTTEELALLDFEQAQKEWLQLTHLRNDPRLKNLVKLGKDILPVLFGRLKDNCVYYLPIEKILEDLDVNTDTEIPMDMTKDGAPPFGSLEMYKDNALVWWEKNKENYIKKESD
jgi:hypothetical protein